ncbi:MAG: CNNM domain-containing protein [Candidatus Thermoplasmatota archaeon]|nr:CNNM domain-containing protein [Candidatus Thermoplasmatota archaeon]
MSPETLIVIYATLAIGASFLCSILEAVLLSTTRGHVAVLESNGSRAASMWIRYKEDPERPLTAILTLNTIAHTVGALGVGTQVEAIHEGQYAMAIASALLTIGVLLFSEILPKTLGTLYWKSLSVLSAYLLQFLIVILIWAVVPIEIVRKMFPAAEQETVSREELVALADIGESEGAIEKDEEKVITNLLRLRETLVNEVMTPSIVITTVNADWSVDKARAEIPIMTHGRLPVIGETIDDVQGIVLRSDILRRAAADEDDILMSDLMRPITFCGEEDSVDNALDVFLEKREQIMIVKDEFGATRGLLTMEDVIETLLGVEIVDEDDLDAIEEGTTAEDLREFAKEKYAQNNGDEVSANSEE